MEGASLPKVPLIGVFLSGSNPVPIHVVHISYVCVMIYMTFITIKGRQK